MTRRANPAQAALFDEPAVDAADVSFIPLAQQFDALPADWKAVLTPCIAQTNWPELCAFVDGERAAGKPI
ncbi:MAG: uracil-DNA glycosylase, partial [Pseudomonadota bacterium]